TRDLLPERAAPPEPSKKPKEEPPPKQREVVETRSARGPGVSVPAPVAGFGILGWMVLAGLLVACIVVAIILYWQQRQRMPKMQPKRATGPNISVADSLLTQPDYIAAATLWQQADELARQGNFLEA